MNVSWLSTEAKTIHHLFENAFITLVLLFLVLGIILEYGKLSIGEIPQFQILVGRVFIACVLCTALPEIMNTLAAITDSIVEEIGKLNEFSHVLSRLGEKFHEMSFSWVSIKNSVLIIISYLTFFFLYITVYLINSLFLIAWMMLYIFSPLLIALFVLPFTSGATIKLFRSLIEVCLWKIIWAVLAALLWSFALSKINESASNVSFLEAILINLMLAISVLMTPLIASSFVGHGYSAVVQGFGQMMIKSAKLSPQNLLSRTKFGASRLVSSKKEKV